MAYLRTVRTAAVRLAVLAFPLQCVAGCGEAPRPAARLAVAEVVRLQTTGLDSLLLAQAFARAAGLPRLHSLLVARHGQLLREQYYHGYTAARRANIKSASKS